MSLFSHELHEDSLDEFGTTVDFYCPIAVAARNPVISLQNRYTEPHFILADFLIKISSNLAATGTYYVPVFISERFINTT